MSQFFYTVRVFQLGLRNNETMTLSILALWKIKIEMSHQSLCRSWLLLSRSSSAFQALPTRTSSAPQFFSLSKNSIRSYLFDEVWSSLSTHVARLYTNVSGLTLTNIFNWSIPQNLDNVTFFHGKGHCLKAEYTAQCTCHISVKSVK